MDDGHLKNLFLSFSLGTLRNLSTWPTPCFEDPKNITIGCQNECYNVLKWCHNGPNVIHGLKISMVKMGTEFPVHQKGAKGL